MVAPPVMLACTKKGATRTLAIAKIENGGRGGARVNNGPNGGHVVNGARGESIAPPSQERSSATPPRI